MRLALAWGGSVDKTLGRTPAGLQFARVLLNAITLLLVACSRESAPSPTAAKRPTAARPLPKTPARPSGELVARAKASQTAHKRSVRRSDIITVIDLNRPSAEERLWVIDCAHGDRVLFQSRTSHAALSDDPKTHTATTCGNAIDSKLSSPGAYVTGKNLREGKFGLSLEVDGLNRGVNDNARKRAILFHTNRMPDGGTMGLSWGCFTVPVERAGEVLNLIAGQTFVYVAACEKSDGTATAP